MEALNNKTDLIAAHEKYEVDRTMHRENREKTVKAFREKHSNVASNSVFFFKGDITHSIHDGDTEHLPDQEANFWYLFGVEDPDLFGVVEVDTGRSVLFVPELPRELSMWMTLHNKEYFKANYDIDEVLYMSEMEEYFRARVLGTIYFFYGVDSDSKLTPALPEFEFLSKHKTDKEVLYPILCEVRVIKSKKEIDILRVVGKVSSDIHILCMRNNKAGIREYQIEALYKFASQSTLGARWLAYSAICASGHGCATLHYIDNDKKFEDGQLTLCDMGLKFYGYCSDITCTYPVNGKFTEKQKHIYNAVLEATNAVKNAVKPGVNWGDMHLLAERIIVKNLISYGIIKNVPIEELEEKRVGAVFFPHGLGHFLGLRVHDVGGYLPGCPERHTKLGLKSLRTRRDLQAGMCITVEPGCYFTKYTLDTAKENPEVKEYINWDKVEEYREVGGVRIEDDIIITENGHEDFTQVPRTVEEIELCMAGKEWRKTA
jgi:Xaa-Pro dipeptidase